MDFNNFQTPEAMLSYVKNIFHKRRHTSERQPPRYLPEERALAVRLLSKGFSQQRLVDELEIGFSTLYRWNVSEQKSPFKRPAPRSLSVIPCEPENKLTDQAIPPENNLCEIKITSSITITISVASVNSCFLTEVIKAVKSC